MNKLLVVANWKANKTVAEAQDWEKRIGESVKGLGNYEDKLEIVVAAPFTLLSALRSSLYASLAVQDLSQFSPGTYTGEVPAELLKDLGVKYCLIGHSERRKYLHETTEMVGKKMDRAISVGITPIICAQSLEEIPPNIRNYKTNQYLIMFEPFSAISTEGQYHPEEPANIKSTLLDWQTKLPQGSKFLYGGSVNPDNISLLFPLTASPSPLLSGFVIGHASLDPKTFYEIIERLCSSPA